MKHRLTRLVYRLYRAAKRFFLTRKVNVFTHLFFWALDRAQSATAERKPAAADVRWRADYIARYGRLPIYRVETDSPVALSAADHRQPRGSLYDNSTNRNFNRKLYEWFGRSSDLRVLDLGCAGGGFVRTILEDGFTAVGIEGSDISRRLHSGEWDNCPYHLMTADVTKPFRILTAAGDPVQFQCVTAWEVLEHIPREYLPGLIANILAHLSADGIFVASVDTSPDGNPVTGAVYHHTLESKVWWLKEFRKAELVEAKGHSFTTRDYVRGHGMGMRDWDPADGEGFHLVLRRASAN